MNVYTAADLRAWALIGGLIALTGYLASRYAATGTGFIGLAVVALTAALLLVAWSRRRYRLERAHQNGAVR